MVIWETLGDNSLSPVVVGNYSIVIRPQLTMRKIFYPARDQTGNLGDLLGSFVIICKLLILFYSYKVSARLQWHYT